ncbi:MULTISPECIES: DUF3280 domain-containing protein [unclassified Bradyrhizobium]|uniref:DUF3280 domain-containing protein n=1 Tax=unclassified Bradyrhizobium TaxID=2631580 RepID=UPI00102E8F58|nr:MULTISPECIES: DUF3280 domain-containing protein [unclassified Bradyrhizobium]MDI4238259.1 DUF2380 domain-containing protein [Bradyrhizobium sp. Arg237L]TAI62540.1 hypothetical protein CWO89_29130 [Bradyrhizobium sp. Leo170]
MRRYSLDLLTVTVLGLLLGFGSASADSGAPAARTLGVTIEDFGYLDTSGEPIDQTAAHLGRLQTFMAALRRDVEVDGHYRLVPPSTDDRATSAERMQAAAQRGANVLITGAVQKMSTLVQFASAAVIDVDTNRILFERRYTFRGDNDEAWNRAETFLSRDIRAALAAQLAASPAVASTPIALAVFDFELEDTTAAAQASGVAASDAAQLADVTYGVRELFAQSGRYRMIETSGTNAEAVKAHTLRDCGGCEAGIAAKLGADQSLIGVVRRVSRTEYTIGFQVRDSRTGAVVSQADSGLRMGADYSWRRGAVRLVKDHLLENQAQQ